MSDNTGGPAFPTKSYDVARQTWTIEEGMTMRDYFAAKAMQGFLAKEYANANSPIEIAEGAYEQADAMLKAREQ